jgi:hypothetical protein
VTYSDYPLKTVGERSKEKLTILQGTALDNYSFSQIRQVEIYSAGAVLKGFPLDRVATLQLISAKVNLVRDRGGGKWIVSFRINPIEIQYNGVYRRYLWLTVKKIPLKNT